MKMIERIMEWLGWVRVKHFEKIARMCGRAMSDLWDERIAHAATKQKLNGIAALTPEQRSARTAKGNRTRALRRRGGVNSGA